LATHSLFDEKGYASAASHLVTDGVLDFLRPHPAIANRTLDPGREYVSALKRWSCEVPTARILTTGGAGYVGSHCAKALGQRGIRCRVRSSSYAGKASHTQRKGQCATKNWHAPDPTVGCQLLAEHRNWNRDCTICAGMVL